MKKYLQPLSLLIKIAKEKNMNYIQEIGYSNLKGKKYYVIHKNKPNLKIHFGSINMSDYTFHKDLKRRDRFRNRHRNNDYKNQYKGIHYSWNLLW